MNTHEFAGTNARLWLDPSPEQIIDQGHAAVQLMADYYSQPPTVPILPHVTSNEIRSKLGDALPYVDPLPSSHLANRGNLLR
jgi:hypothetical protein